MKCPNCSTTNGNTNKYCRECGYKLDGSADVASAAGLSQDSSTIVLDEVGLREELFEVWQLLEAGEVATSRRFAEKLVEQYPESAAANSLMALIYERIAGSALEEGREQAWREFLKLAIGHYENIIDLNPDSTADREKLASLRIKLAGRSVVGKKSTSLAVPPAINDLIRKARLLPLPVKAAAGAFILCLIVILTLTSGGKPDPAKTETARNAAASASQNGVNDPMGVTSTPMAPVTPPSQQPAANLNPYPTPPSAPIARAPVREPNQLEQPSTAGEQETVAPTRINIPKLDLTLTPVARPKSEKQQQGKISIEVRKAEKLPVLPDQSARQLQPKSEQPEATPGGASVLAQAVQLYGQGRNGEAVTAAEQAAAQFESDITAGKNVEAARRGLVNARKIIAACRSKSGASE